MNVLLIQPPIEDFYITRQRLQPTGLLYLASSLSSQGHQVRILDLLTPPVRTTIPLDPGLKHLEPLIPLDRTGLFKNYSRFGVASASLDGVFQSEEFEVCGISANFAAYVKTALEAAAAARRARPGAFIVVGGNAVPVCAEYFLESGYVDAVVFGEGETTFTEILERLKESKDLDGIGNIAFRRAGAVIRTPAVSNFDIRGTKLATGFLDHGRYPVGGRRALSAVTSRGCPFKCSYCTAGLNCRSGYQRDPSAAETIGRYIRDEAITALNLEDENFTLDRSAAEEFLTAKIRDFPEVRLFLMNGLDYRTLDEGLLTLLRKVDLKNLGLALVDSSGGGDDRNFDRSLSIDKFSSVVRSAKGLGFDVTSYLIAGLPGQTVRGIRETAEYLWSLGSVVGLSPFYAVPGAPLADKLGWKALAFSAMRSTALLSASEHMTSRDILDLLAFCREGNLPLKAKS